ncbi:hypothetical protein MNV49_000214 [Pseudohyphozyma bogoriensis]|nr:hypothetical protein MNV49_000214 [Pseudohyphozyma bogoriensis]
MSTPNSAQTIDELVALEPVAIAEQHAPEQARLCQTSLNAYLNSIASNSTKSSSKNRWKRYSDWCDQVGLDPFPVVPTTVALSLYDLGKANQAAGKAWDSHVTVLNAIRKATLHHFTHPPDPLVAPPAAERDFLELNLMSYEPLRTFCRAARQAALTVKNKKAASIAAAGPLPNGGPQKGRRASTGGAGAVPAAAATTRSPGKGKGKGKAKAKVKEVTTITKSTSLRTLPPRSSKLNQNFYDASSDDNDDEHLLSPARSEPSEDDTKPSLSDLDPIPSGSQSQASSSYSTFPATTSASTSFRSGPHSETEEPRSLAA